MAQVGISEFTFGFGFLSEQTQRHWTNLRVAPVLPSLQQEQHEGWDAHLPLTAADYYYQFKLSDYLEHANSKFIAKGIYPGAYYRIALHRRNWNQQHQRLKIHSIKNPNTYYVAPEFHNIAAFNSAFMSKQLLNSSRLIPLADCKNIADNNQHYITFRYGAPTWKFHSDPETHETSINGANIQGLYRDGRHQFRKVDDGFAAELFHKAAASAQTVITKESDKKKRTKRPTEETGVMAAAQGLPTPEIEAQAEVNREVEPKDIELLDYNPERHRRRDVLKRTSQVLSVFFGLTLVLVGERGRR
ncbi:MAG: hypothetical protein JWR19_1015 [Pedosphaera sp.]|nr:hypothetical protein [Pedosphaera sp.]